MYDEEKINWAPTSGKCILKKAELLSALKDRCELVIANAHKGDDGGKGVTISS